MKQLMATGVDRIKYLNLLWLAICAVLIGIFLLVTPKYIDDYWFMSGMREWFEMQGLVSPQDGGDVFKYGMPWNVIADTIKYHCNIDCTRLSNMPAILLLPFPKWVASFPVLCAWIAQMILMLKLARIDWCSSRLVPCAVGMWILFVSWYENMGSVMYQYNYIVPVALALWLLYLLFDDKRGTKRYIAIFILSFIAGAWHEMIATPLIPAFALLIACSKGAERCKYIAALSGSVLAIVWIMLCPDFFNRASIELWEKDADIKRSLKILIFYHFGILIFLAGIIFRIAKRGWRNVFNDRLLLISLIVCLFSCGLCLSVREYVRAGWFGDMMAILGILYLANTSDMRLTITKRKILYMSSYMFMTVGFMTAGISDWYMIKYASEYRRGVEEVGNGQRESVFLNVKPVENLPIVTQRFIAHRFLWDSFIFMDTYYRRLDRGGLMKIVPAELRSFDFEASPPIPGNSGARWVDDYIVVRYQEGKESSAGYFKMEFGPFYKDGVPVVARSFVNERDGKTYAFILLTDRQVYRRLFGIRKMDKL